MRNPTEAVFEHKEFLEKEKAFDSDKELLGIFLYGSQNYNVATENSDVDTKAIYVPSLREAICEEKRLVKTYVLPNEEHCELMDIRHLVNNYCKQNINFVETLFTDYCWINPKYKDLWDKYFISQREDIARYDISYGIASAVGQAVHTLKQDPTDAKKLANGYRFEYFLKRYPDISIPYKDCITVSDAALRDIIIEFKNFDKPLGTPFFSDVMADKLLKIKEETKVKSDINKMNKIKKRMDEGIIKIIMRGEEL